MIEWLRLARPRQWVKNLLLGAAFLFTAGEAWTPDDPGSWAPLIARTALAFLIFCVLSSGGYFLNDARDREADRAHPKKRERPVAAGTITPERARLAGLILMSVGVVLAGGLGPAFGLTSIAYALGTWSYSARLKRIAILDVAVVAGLFALRAVAGAYAIEVPPSPWLVLCTFSGALFVSSVKRQQETLVLGTRIAEHRPGRAMRGASRSS